MRSFAIFASLLSLIATLGVVSRVSATGSAGNDGFILPANLTSGLYTAYFDDTGKEVHELLSTDLTTGSLIPPTLDKRQQYSDNQEPYTLCGCGFDLGVSGCNAAVSTLENWAGNGITMSDNTVVYVIDGGVVAFVCSNNGEAGPTTLDSESLVEDYQVITANCGWYVAGTYIVMSDAAYWEYLDRVSGYMQYINGMNICAAARYGTANYC